MNDEFMNDNTQTHLEPRVARLETGLETLTRNVSDLTVSLREYSSETNRKLDTLSIAVTTAQAPRRTDWGVLISAFALIMALGAAVLVPINNATSENRQYLKDMHQEFVDHKNLTLHPVGSALVNRLETQMALHATQDKEEIATLGKNMSSEIESVNKRSEFFNEKILLRVEKLETRNLNIDDKDNDELRRWRLKALGFHTPNIVPPILPRMDK